MNSLGRRLIQYSFAAIAAGTFSYSFAQEQPGALYYDVSSQLPMPACSGPAMDVESADVDGDGDLDVIIAHEFASNVLLINDGKGNFTHKAGAFSQKDNDSEDIAVADFDSDGDMDVVFVSEDNGQHEFYANDGAGNFKDLSSLLPESTANAVTAADINNDGYPDLVIGNAGQDLILINKGTGTFDAAEPMRFFEDETGTRLPADESITQDIELADIDKDGDLDMICGNEDKNKILINNGAGIFTDETATRLTGSVDMETRKVTLGDVDGDGDLDLYLSNVAFLPNKNTQNRIYFNNGEGVFSDMTLKNLPADNEDTMDGKFLDIDGDGDLDLITGDVFDKSVLVLTNNGAGKFIDATTTLLPAVSTGDNLGIEIADFDSDGKKDMYICRRGQAAVMLMANAPTSVQESNLLKTAQVAPNPFKNSTKFAFELPRAMNIKASIFSAQGEKVATFAEKTYEAGPQEILWSPEGIAPGIYFLKIEGENFKSSGMAIYSGNF